MYFANFTEIPTEAIQSIIVQMLYIKMGFKKYLFNPREGIKRKEKKIGKTNRIQDTVIDISYIFLTFRDSYS